MTELIKEAIWIRKIAPFMNRAEVWTVCSPRHLTNNEYTVPDEAY